MKTIEIRLSDLLARTVEEGDCLLWTGHSSSGKFPQWRVGGKLQPARRVVWSLAHECQPVGQVGCNCGTLLCMHPDHLVDRTRSKIMRGRTLTPGALANITLKRRRGSTLDMDKVRAIRASDEPGGVIEARYGLKPGYASKIRHGLVWKDLASPFFGLGMRV